MFYLIEKPTFCGFFYGLFNATNRKALNKFYLCCGLIHQLLYRLFFNLPYALIALTIPITIYDGLVIYRYRLSQPSMIALSIGVSTIILVGGLLFADTAWLGLASWLGVAFLFRANFKRFFNFLEAKQEAEEELDSEPDTEEVL